MDSHQPGSAQLSLFEPILSAYATRGKMSNAQLYEHLADKHIISESAFDVRIPIGQAGELHNPARRRVRWIQQTLKRLGLLERVDEQRGVWKATERGRKGLTTALPGKVVLAFSTDLGIAVWGRCQTVFPLIDR